MKEARFPSMGLKSGFRVGIFSSIDEGDKQAGRPGAMLDAANDSAIAWGAGSEARKKYVALLEKTTGVARKYVEKDNKDKTKKLKSYSSSDGGESEGNYGKRIYALLVKNDPSVHKALHEFKIAATITGDARETAVDDALQSLADSLGVFNADLKLAEKSKKTAELAQRYKDAAANIIKNGSEAKWVDTFTKEGIAFLAFNVPVAGDEATQAATAASNALNLATAIKAREQKKNEAAEEKRKAEYQ